MKENGTLKKNLSPPGAQGDAGSGVGQADDTFLLNAPLRKPSRGTIPDNALILHPRLCSSSKYRSEDPE